MITSLPRSGDKVYTLWIFIVIPRMGYSIATLATLMLVVGLMVVGASLTLTETVTITKTRPITPICTTTVTTTITKTLTKTVIKISPITLTLTSTVTQTVTSYTTVMETTTQKEVEYVCFSKPDNCSSIIIRLIDSAERYVYVAIYSFTLDNIGDALIRAKNRGVDVKVVIEKDQAGIQGSEYERLLNAGVDVRLDGNPYLMHHKFMIVDGKIVVTGSYNWSYSAEERNDENLVVILSPSIAKLYEDEFNRIWYQAS